MSHITLPRAVVEQVREALKELDYASEPEVNQIARTALAALDAALAEPDAIARAVEAEREACAEICDAEATIEGIAQRCAANIRARGAQMSDAINPNPYTQGDKDCIDAINPNHYKQGDKEGIDALRAALWNGIRARGSK